MKLHPNLNQHICESTILHDGIMLNLRARQTIDESSTTVKNAPNTESIQGTKLHQIILNEFWSCNSLLEFCNQSGVGWGTGILPPPRSQKTYRNVHPSSGTRDQGLILLADMDLSLLSLQLLSGLFMIGWQDTYTVPRVLCVYIPMQLCPGLGPVIFLGLASGILLIKIDKCPIVFSHNTVYVRVPTA